MSKNLTCNIIAGGNLFEPFTRPDLKNYFTICADSGYDSALKMGFRADLVIGDLDSISVRGTDLIKDKKVNFIQSIADQDMTDTELAIRLAINMGYKNINILNPLGSRADHSLSNIMNLVKYRDYKIRLINKFNEIILLDRDLKLEKSVCNISIIPLSEEGISLTTKGFLYDMESTKITLGSSLGISNKIKDDMANIVVEDGYGLLIKSWESD